MKTAVFWCQKIHETFERFYGAFGNSYRMILVSFERRLTSLPFCRYLASFLVEIVWQKYQTSADSEISAPRLVQSGKGRTKNQRDLLTFLAWPANWRNIAKNVRRELFFEYRNLFYTAPSNIIFISYVKSLPLNMFIDNKPQNCPGGHRLKVGLGNNFSRKGDVRLSATYRKLTVGRGLTSWICCALPFCPHICQAGDKRDSRGLFRSGINTEGKVERSGEGKSLRKVGKAGCRKLVSEVTT